MSKESSAIVLSASANVVLGMLGLGFGLYVDSSAILLDGLFNVISLLAALLTLWVSRLVLQPKDERFPFGYALFEPMLNTFKSAVILGTSVLALVDAVKAILGGGKELSTGLALVYAGISVTACFAVALVQRAVAKSTESPLVRVDAKNWFVNGAISGAVGLAFLTATLLAGTSASVALPYVDPVLVLLLVLVTAPIPVRIAMEGLAELLGAAPPSDVVETVRERFDAAVAGSDVVERSELSVAVAGRYLYVLGHVLAGREASISDLDTLRAEIAAGLEPVHPLIVTDILFTRQERWL